MTKSSFYMVILFIVGKIAIQAIKSGLKSD